MVSKIALNFSNIESFFSSMSIPVTILPTFGMTQPQLGFKMRSCSKSISLLFVCPHLNTHLFTNTPKSLDGEEHNTVIHFSLKSLNSPKIKFKVSITYVLNYLYRSCNNTIDPSGSQGTSNISRPMPRLVQICRQKRDYIQRKFSLCRVRRWRKGQLPGKKHKVQSSKDAPEILNQK